MRVISKREADVHHSFVLFGEEEYTFKSHDTNMTIKAAENMFNTTEHASTTLTCLVWVMGSFNACLREQEIYSRILYHWATPIFLEVVVIIV